MKNRLIAALLITFNLVSPIPMQASGALTTGHLNHLEHYITDLSNATFHFDQILKDYPYVVVDFYANWCNPCQRMLPILEALAADFNDVIFIKINIGMFKSISDRYGVQSIPTLIFFKDGSIASRSAGLKSKSELATRLNSIYHDSYN